MSRFLYTYESKPSQSESLLKDLESHESEIFHELGLFSVPWEREFYGSLGKIKTHLRYTGEIIVNGPEKEKCIETIKEVSKKLEKIFGEAMYYGTPKLVKVEFQQDAKVEIFKIISETIIDIVKDNISEELNVNDIILNFVDEQFDRNLKLIFERGQYLMGEEDVPFRVIIIGRDKNECNNIWKDLQMRLNITAL